MAYYNYGYPQYYPQTPTTAQAPAMPGQQGGGIIWVSGEAGAKAYMVAPNTTVQLWDSENQVIYLKSADASGMPSMKILDYKIRDMQSQPQISVPIPQSEYVTKDEFTAFEEQIKKQISELRREENE